MTAGEEAPTPAAAVAAHDLRFAYGGGPARPAPRSFSLHVAELVIAPGEAIVIHGPSGGGKSTLLRLLAGILAPDAGELRVGELDLASASSAARRHHRLAQVGFVFQDYPLLDALSCLENVLLPFRLTSQRIDARHRARAGELLDRLGILHLRGARPRGLSQGERQRVAIARALVSRPRLLLADEPTTGLDPARAAEALDLLFEARTDEGLTLVVVSHDESLHARFDRSLAVDALLEDQQGSEASA